MMKQFTAYIVIFLIALLANQGVMAQAKKDSTTLNHDIDRSNLIGVDSNLKIPVGYELSRSMDELTSSVGAVRANQLETNGSVINPENLFYGKIPGLMTIGSGGSGTTAPRADFYIRGRGSFRSSAPLILLDGLRVSDIKTLSTNAIESVSVLKDAAATAMYGARGANGVILITTKRGSEHPLQVHLNYNQSLTQPVGLPDMLDGPQYARAQNEARFNDGLSPRYSPHDLNSFDSGDSPYLFPNVDWFDEVFSDFGSRSNMSATFEGGGGTVRYFSLLAYDHYSGIYQPTDKDRGYKAQQKYGQLNFRTNLDVDLTNDLLFKFNVSSFLYDSNVPSEGTSNGDVINALYRTPSAAYPVKLPDGTWGGTQIYNVNPVAKYRDTGFGNLNARQLGIDAALQQDLDSWVQGLSAEAKVHFVDFGSWIEGKNRDYKYGFMSATRDIDGNITGTTVTKYGENTQLDYSTTFNNQSRHTAVYGKVNYATSFGDDQLDAMVLVQQNSDNYDGTNNLFRYRKVAANVQYGLNGKYFFNVTGSYAGRNLLPKENRYNLFPAVSVGWLLSNEGFLQDASFLDRLKLRASWGIVGNDAIPNNKPYIRSYDYGGSGYYFENDNVGQAGVIENDLPSSDFRIAKSRKTNLGIDAGFFDQLDLTLDFFYAKRSDILTGSGGRYSDVLGIGTALKSDGIVENKGMEIGANWQDAIGDFAWNIGGQFTYARNKIINMDEEYRPEPYLRRTGQSVGQRFGLQAIGLFKDQQDIANSPAQSFTSVKPGDIKYRDQNGDGIIDQYDEVPIGYSEGYPEMYFSASVGFQYKRIALSALFQGAGHMTAYLNTESVYWPLRDDNTISDYYYNRRWTPNTANSATLPRLTTQDNDNNFRSNSTWLRDQSYIMLRNLKLTYSLPVSIAQKLNMDHIEFVARGRNLFSIDHIPVGRPEQYDSSYPLQRYYSLGVNVAF